MSKLLADKKKLFDIDKDNLMFHNKALFALLIPIVVEQLLNSFMGMVDTMMVSNLGSQAISGVSLEHDSAVPTIADCCDILSETDGITGVWGSLPTPWIRKPWKFFRMVEMCLLQLRAK